MRHYDATTSVRVLVAAAHAQGRTVRLVTGGADRHTAFVAFAEGLGLPDWFGHNLDALTDALRDLADQTGRPIELVWDRVAQLRACDPRTYAAIEAVLADVEGERGDLHVSIVDR